MGLIDPGHRRPPPEAYRMKYGWDGHRGMARFLIEVEHEDQKAACDSAVRTFLQTGSQFLANADWGCSDGAHKAWLIADLGSKDEALAVVPPSLRAQAKVVSLQRFSMSDVGRSRATHRG